MTLFHALRARLRLLASSSAESRIDDEIRFHIEMETQKLVREQHLDHDEARRRALATFGGVQQHRETLRAGRDSAWFSGVSLDVKLGFRMLAKYPGLAVIGGLAIAFGIWFGAVTIQMLSIVNGTKLPIPDGDRIAQIQNFDQKLKQEDGRMLYDYQVWRSARSITDLGAFRDASVNLVGASGSAQTVFAAEVSASAFRIAPERPVLGRVLTEADERAGAPPVVVLGHEVWTGQFNSDPGIVGRTVRLGTGFSTVVGVMPEAYAFPTSHELWLPLRTDVPGIEPRGGTDIEVFARLADGMTFETAQAELRALGQRLAAERPLTHAQIQTHVVPYAQASVLPKDIKFMGMIYFFVVALVVLVCSTVALLLFARAASRETEIIVRSALGASRGRIVAQLFAEALVLASVAAIAGLAAAQFTMTRVGEPYLQINMGRLPFWYDFDLSPSTIVMALGLAVLGAVVAGVMPARKITRGLGTRLRAGTSGGGGVSFGGVWTAVIVTQVALTVAFPSAVMLIRSEIKRMESHDAAAGFASHEYLGVKLVIDAPAETLTPEAKAALPRRLVVAMEALRDRLEGDPQVAGVTLVDAMPRAPHRTQRTEVLSLPGTPSYPVQTAVVHPAYFTTMQAPIIAGRAFTSADFSPGARVVIVDKGFADLVMPGRNPIGHRVRLSADDTLDSNLAALPRYEIVGLVPEMGMSSPTERQRPAGLYLPRIAGSEGPLKLIVHARGEPLSVVPRIRELATSIDPAFRIDQATRLDQVATPILWFLRLWMKIMIGLTGVALLLSLSGIYAVLSYVVARRTREIGVRVALGAGAHRVITSIFRRPLIQVTTGVAAGTLLIGVLAIAMQYTSEFSATGPRGLAIGEIALLIGYGMLMLCICALACVVPSLRALRVQPMEALRAE